MHRIRVGLTGLACVFLVVMLAAAFLRMTGDLPKADAPATAADNAEAPNEPLAQLGVAPGASLSDSEEAAPAPTTIASPVKQNPPKH